MKKGAKQAFRPAMSLSTGELSGLEGKVLLMTATATKKTMRVLQDQFPEVSKWKHVLHLPLRKNVTMLVPPPEIVSPNYERILLPFITSMKQDHKVYLIIVRGRANLFTSYSSVAMCFTTFSLDGGWFSSSGRPTPSKSLK